MRHSGCIHHNLKKNSYSPLPHFHVIQQFNSRSNLMLCFKVSHQPHHCIGRFLYQHLVSISNMETDQHQSCTYVIQLEYISYTAWPILCVFLSVNATLYLYSYVTFYYSTSHLHRTLKRKGSHVQVHHSQNLVFLGPEKITRKVTNIVSRHGIAFMFCFQSPISIVSVPRSPLKVQKATKPYVHLSFHQQEAYLVIFSYR